MVRADYPTHKRKQPKKKSLLPLSREKAFGNDFVRVSETVRRTVVAPAARALAVVPRSVRATGIALVLRGQLARDRQEDDGRAARANPMDRRLVEPERKGAVARLSRKEIVLIGVADDDHGRQLAVLHDRASEDAVTAFASSTFTVETSH
ncbi:MAG: hypothetical protein EBT03_07835 [Betaproteobacteria bacterium]|nr:hypothetical protein [Betaproteobacteria bacterium]